MSVRALSEKLAHVGRCFWRLVRRIRAYACRTDSWRSPGIVFHDWRDMRWTYTEWDFGVEILCWEIGVGLKSNRSSPNVEISHARERRKET